MIRTIISAYFRKKREKLLTTCFGNTIGGGCAISKNAEILHSNLLFGARVAERASVRNSFIGKYSAIGRNTKVAHSRIGNYCAVSWDVTINALFHYSDSLTNSAFPYVPRVGEFVTESTQTVRKVHVGNDVWIGTHAVIMPGLSIGDGAVVGAGSVVTKDVAPYAISFGIPAKISRYRFDDDVIERLLKIQWWHFEDNLIKANIELFQGKFSKDKLARLEDICI